MPRLLHRVAATLLALPLAALVGTPAAHADDVTVPGCYGVSVVVCDPTVSYGLPVGVETYQTEIPVCAGSCQYVRVTLVRTAAGEPFQVCASYESLSGSVTSRCATVPDTADLVQDVLDIVRNLLEDVDVNEILQNLGETVQDRICRIAAIRDVISC